MIAISRMAKRSLEDENGYINGTPVDWWGKNKWACSWCLLCMIAQIPIVILEIANIDKICHVEIAVNVKSLIIIL